MQEPHIKKILEWFNMQDYNSIDNPIVRDEGLNLKIYFKTPEEKKEMANSLTPMLLNICYMLWCVHSLIFAMPSIGELLSS